MKDSEKEKLLSLQEMRNSSGWKKYMSVWLEEQIEKNSNIKRINDQDDDTILRDFRSKKVKVEVYKGVLQKPDAWIKEIMKGDENNGKERRNS